MHGPWLGQYVYRRELRAMEHNNKKVWVVLARSEATSSIPENSGVVRVQDYIQSAALTSDGKSGTKCKYSRLCWSRHTVSLSILHYLVSVSCITLYICRHFHLAGFFVCLLVFCSWNPEVHPVLGENMVNQSIIWCCTMAAWMTGIHCMQVFAYVQ